MSRIDSLPADQKSVLQLLLRQGKGYDDLSGLLRLDVGEVRTRAHDALDTLGPGAGGVPSAKRKEVADWLLGQQAPDEAAATREFVAGSSAARAWAQTVAGELEPLAGGRLPEIPEAREAAPAASAASSPAPAAAPAATKEEEGGASAGGAAAAGADAPTPIAPAPSGAPRVSRRGGAALIAGALAVAAIVVVLVLVLGGGDDNKKDNAKNAAATTSTAQQQAKVRAQVNLTPPADGPSKKALAIVQIVDLNGQEAVNAVSQGLKASNKAAFAIWVYNSPSQAKLIGGFDKKDNNGHLVYQGALPKDFDITAYNEILVTRETSGNPKSPGTVYLRGTIPKSAGG
jgi:hypothetical protein